MGLFSFLFPKHKILRTTYEAETFRAVFREDEELFQKMEKSDELKRFRELEEYVNNPLFKKKRKEIEQLSYKDSEYYKAEKQYKALLKSRKLQSYLLVYDSKELKGYHLLKTTSEYAEYSKLKVIVMSADFDKKLHITEYAAYQQIIKHPKIAALMKFERLRHFREYDEVKDTNLPKEFEQLAAFIQSDEFRNNRKYLIDKNRYQTTDDYQLLCEYEALKKQPDLIKYNRLRNDPYFCEMCRWKLVFEDGFEQGRLDEMKWITRYYAGERFLNDTYGVGKDVQLYAADNVSFSGSAVCLNFRKESIVGKYWDQQFGLRERTYAYTSGMISTASSFRQRYGRFEAKIKLNRSDLTSCFWMLGDTDVPYVEIMNCRTDGVEVGHVYPYRTAIANNMQLIKDIDLANEYYIFTLEWTEEKMVWMVNDLVVKEERENIPDVPMYIVFSLGACDAPADRCVPGRMEIDWVRGYRLKS
ncbi:MAG: family 16 glycosylhydrolase [Odoribacter sp.]